MNAIDVVRTSLSGSQSMLKMFLGDLSDADLLVRPVPGANHIAWQLGHLIATEQRMGDMLPGSAYPPLPPGFAEAHTSDTAKKDDGFFPKAVYLEQMAAMRAATLAAASKLHEEDLDRPTSGAVARLAPTLGAMLTLLASHDMMHGGQFSVVRRKLGKPILF